MWRCRGDVSSAAFWLVAGLCHSDARVLVRGVGLNPSRTGVVDALRAMGAGDDSLRLVSERVEGGEPVADALVASGQLRGTEIGGDLIPRLLDEIPILAVAACFAEGETVIRDAGGVAGQGVGPDCNYGGGSWRVWGGY